MTYAGIAKRVRLPLGFLLGAAYIAFARPTGLGLVTGGAIALLGVVIRGWAAGHIEKNVGLAMSGPYAHTRNPLYFGSFLIAAGFAIVVHWALLLLVISFFVLVYAPTIEAERRRMLGAFPDSYGDYAANVPAFIPRPLPWGDETIRSRRFRWSLYLRHGEWRAAVTYLLVMAWLAYRLKAGF